ncbi:MAG: YbhB/YbcL family Raf kinase inhibitor-like protein [Candidatus Lokiarchaeota archaeon]|nr:YbhB/YbcL family Raf kinase inhibitor-like protein [Candidatus Lokiarchaeota archaeon]
MKLFSDDFEQDGMIPQKFTCDGADISPHLKWQNAPEDAKSFAVSCNDPDAPAGDWIHWIVHDIPSDVNEIPQGGPVPGSEAKNDFGKTSYGGPCPPGGVHRYFFRVYALDTESLMGITKNNFTDKFEEHAIAKAELMGKYGR